MSPSALRRQVKASDVLELELTGSCEAPNSARN